MDQRTEQPEAESPKPNIDRLAEAETRRRRSAIFEAIALTAENLLTTADLGQSVTRLLARLGEATQSDRVHVFRNERDASTGQRYEWSAAGIRPIQDRQTILKVVHLQVGQQHWMGKPTSDFVFQGHAQAFPPEAREVLLAQNIQSILVVPIFVREEWWGCVCFDSHQGEREWSSSEIEAFRTAAGIIGAALENASLHQETRNRAWQLEALHDINRTIGSTLDQDKVLHLTLNQVCQLFEAQLAAAYLADLLADTAHRHAVAGPSTATAKLAAPLPLRNSLTGHVIITGRPVFIERDLMAEADLTNENHYSPYADNIQSELPLDATTPGEGRASIQAAAFIPLAVGEHVLGTINIAFDRRRALGDDEKKLLMAIGRQAGIALANARLFQEIVTAEREARRQAEQLAALHEIDQAINSKLEPAAVYSRIVKHATDLLDCQLSNLYLWEPASDEALGVASFEADSTDPAVPGIVGQRFDANQSLINKEMLDTRAPVVISDAASDPRVSPVFRQRYLARAVLALPLISREQITGFLYLVDQTDPRQWRESEITIAGQLAALAAIAIENARLFATEQKSRQTAEALQKTAQIVNRSLDLDQALNLLLEQLYKLVPYDSAAVFLYEDKMLRAATGRGFPDLKVILQLTIDPSENALVKQILETGQPLALVNAQQDERFQSWGGTNYVRGWIGVPLLVGAELVGILTIDSRQSGAFDEESARLAQALADQTSIVIHKARLLADLQDANQELRRLDDLKNQFIQNVAHELRTPLTLVRGYTELLAQGNLDLPTQHEAIQIALSHTETLVRLVEGITTLQDLSLGELVLQPVNPSDLVKTALQLATQKAVRASINLKADCPPDLPHISGDFIWLSQALFQVLDNAIKFSPDGDHVTLELRLDPDTNELVIEVEDHGIGIPHDEQHRIFRLFYQVDGSTTRRFSGTGLGLAIVQRVIQAHGGQVWVESPIKQADNGQASGSRFIIRLPQKLK